MLNSSHSMNGTFRSKISTIILSNSLNVYYVYLLWRTTKLITLPWLIFCPPTIYPNFFIESRQTDFSVQHLSKILYIVVSWQLKKEILIFMHANSFTIVENGNGHHKSSAACIDEFSRRFFLCSFWSFSILIWFAFFFSNSHFFFLFVSRNFARHTRNINRAQQ